MPKYEITYNCGYHCFRDNGKVLFKSEDRNVTAAWALGYLMFEANVRADTKQVA